MGSASKVETEHIKEHLGLFVSESSIQIQIEGYPEDGHDYTPIVEAVRLEWPEIAWSSSNCPPANSKYANTHGIEGTYAFRAGDGPAMLPLLNSIVRVLITKGLFDDRLRFQTKITEGYAPLSSFGMAATS